MDKEIDENEEKKIKGINIWLFIAIALMLSTISISAYVWNFHDQTISSSSADWGTFGDFMGGTLNPMLAFLSLIALLYTINLQSKELHETRKAAKDSAEALGEQSKSIRLQNFENTFFNLLTLHNEITNNLQLLMLKKNSGRTNHFIDKPTYYYSIQGEILKIVEDKDYNGKQTISKLFDIYQSYVIQNSGKKKNIDIRTLYNHFYKEYNEIIGHYFRNIYHILKFIEKQTEKDLIDKKFYSNLLRAQLSNRELALLLINALSMQGSSKLLPLLIKFEFMEPLPITLIDNSYLKKIAILCLAKTNYLNKREDTNYPKWKIFGKKGEWKGYINRVLKNYN